MNLKNAGPIIFLSTHVLDNLIGYDRGTIVLPLRLFFAFCCALAIWQIWDKK